VVAESKEDKLLQTFLNNMNLGDFKISEAYAVSNRTLAQNFCNCQAIQSERMKRIPHIFFKKNWENKPDKIMRKRTMDSYKKLITSWEWNKDDEISNSPILVAAHGTSYETAKKIMSGGFATLSLLDDGFYGQGIYLSSQCIYTFPYCAIYNDPCVIICFIIPGNPYPVTENPVGKFTLSGCNILSGYQSHYVITRRDGLPFTEVDYENEGVVSYDEFVVAQEAQVLPLFVLLMDKSNFQEISEKHQRETTVNDEMKLMASEDGAGIEILDMRDKEMKDITEEETPFITTNSLSNDD